MDDSPRVPEVEATARLLRTWTTKNGLRLLHFATDPAVIVKVGPDWSVKTAASVADGYLKWREILQSVEGIYAPAARAVYAPPSVVMEYVEGRELLAAIRQKEDLSRALHACGRAIGAYHRSGGEQSPALARDRVRTVLRRLRVSKQTEQRLLRAVVPVASTGDFGPYNARLDVNDQVAVIDPVTRLRVDTAHRDVAWFLWWLRRESAGRAATDALMMGYREESRHDFSVGDGQELLRLLCAWFAMGASRQQMRRGRPLRAAQFTYCGVRYRLNGRNSERERSKFNAEEQE